jgi:hypothetical protein
MGPKLLFVLGIVVAHGALAAGWIAHEPPKQRVSIGTCVRTPNAPNALPHYSPPRELLARAAVPVIDLRMSQR